MGHLENCVMQRNPGYLSLFMSVTITNRVLT